LSRLFGRKDHKFNIFVRFALEKASSFSVNVKMMVLKGVLLVIAPSTGLFCVWGIQTITKYLAIQAEVCYNSSKSFTKCAQEALFLAGLIGVGKGRKASCRR
jgi:hypothetical protein